jgi:hypothetical protein
MVVRRWQTTLGVSVGGACLVIAALAPAAFAASGPVSSTLAKGTLNSSIWHVLNQDSSFSMSTNAGWMTIGTETAPVASFTTKLHDMVLQPVSSSANWTVSVETTFFGKPFGPSGTLPNYQGGGIYAWQDATHWVRMLRQPSNCTLGIQIDDGTWGSQTGLFTASGQALPTGTVTENGVQGTPAYTTACNNSDDPLWLRLTKQGNLYTGYYSTNGTTWVQAESFQDPVLTVNDIGLNASEGGGTAPPINMGFKDFVVAGSSGTASTTPSTTATTSSTSSTTSSSSSGGAVPKTGSGPATPLAGLALLAAGVTLALGRRRTRAQRG